MPLFSIPLVSLVSAIVLVNLIYRGGSHRIVPVVSMLAGVCNLILAASAFCLSRSPAEYQFSTLFILPGSYETMSFSLQADSVSIVWMLFMTPAALCISLLGWIDRSKLLNESLAVFHLAQAGLATFILSGSPVTSMIGWGITLSAALIAFRINPALPGDFTSGTPAAGERIPDPLPDSPCTVLMFPVFLILAASFLLYGLTGKLSFSGNPESMVMLVRTLLGPSGNPLVERALTLTSLFIVLSVLPGMGTFPFTAWLSGTRTMHPIPALFILTVILPSGLLLIQRLDWLFPFTPVTGMLAIAGGTLTLIMAALAVFSLRNPSMTLPWLAAACASMMLIVHFLSPAPTASLLLKTLYPGLVLFSFGLLAESRYRIHAGRTLQFIGLLLPWAIAITLSATRPEAVIPVIVPGAVSIIVFTILAGRIRFASGEPVAGASPFTSSMGWSAYRFFGSRSIVQYMITWPIQQLSDGFLILESAITFFVTHVLASMIRSWGRLLWLFDSWCINRAAGLLKNRRHPDLRHPGKKDYIALICFTGLCITGRMIKDWILWIQAFPHF